MSSLVPTFMAALQAVGTATTMASAGFYIHRRGFVTPSGKKMMALLSQQVTIPAFLFAKIIYCPSGSKGGGRRLADDFADINTHEAEIVCPSVADRIADLWVILFWPAYVVFCGLLVGYMAAKVSNTPLVQTRSCLAACAFGNSTGLPITLLTVIHKQFRATTELGSIDATAFLSVFLLLYPVLQWGVGGWLLAPDEKDKNDNKDESNGEKQVVGTSKIMPESSNKMFGANDFQLQKTNNKRPQKGHRRRHTYHISHILNEMPSQSFTDANVAGQEEFGGVPPRHIYIPVKKNDENKFVEASVHSSNTLSMLVRELSFDKFANSESFGELPSQPSLSKMEQAASNISRSESSDGVQLAEQNNYLLPRRSSDEGPLMMDHAPESSSAETGTTDSLPEPFNNPPTIHENVPLLTNKKHSYTVTKIENGSPSRMHHVASQQEIDAVQEMDVMPLTGTLYRVALKVFQPPVIGSLAGLFIATFPSLRGIFVNIWGLESGLGAAVPLQWMFDGVYAVGQAAVPINMMILGINLSSTFQRKTPKKKSEPVDIDVTNHISNMSIDKKESSKKEVLPNRTMFAVVVGKMLVMPAIGVFSTWFMQKYLELPDEIDATCYLVMMIVFITPTANNVMVMVELSGSSSKEGMARLIGFQYLVAPVILSFVLAAVVNLASCHFDMSATCT